MSIQTELKSYADRATTSGKQALSQAQAQLNDVTGQANELYGKVSASVSANVSDIAEKAAEAAGDLRTSAEKAVNFEAIKAAVEPYVSQVLGYTATVTERAEALLAEARKDKRVASLIDAVEDVLEQVEEKVVKPALARTPFATAKSATPAPAATPAAKAAPTRPATKSAAPKPAKKVATKATARKAPARKAAAKKAKA